MCPRVYVRACVRARVCVFLSETEAEEKTVTQIETQTETKTARVIEIDFVEYNVFKRNFITRVKFRYVIKKNCLYFSDNTNTRGFRRHLFAWVYFIYSVDDFRMQDTTHHNHRRTQRDIHNGR